MFFTSQSMLLEHIFLLFSFGIYFKFNLLALTSSLLWAVCIVLQIFIVLSFTIQLSLHPRSSKWQSWSTCEYNCRNSQRLNFLNGLSYVMGTMFSTKSSDIACTSSINNKNNNNNSNNNKMLHPEAWNKSNLMVLSLVLSPTHCHGEVSSGFICSWRISWGLQKISCWSKQ